MNTKNNMIVLEEYRQKSDILKVVMKDIQNKIDEKEKNRFNNLTNELKALYKSLDLDISKMYEESFKLREKFDLKTNDLYVYIINQIKMQGEDALKKLNKLIKIEEKKRVGIESELEAEEKNITSEYAKFKEMKKMMLIEKGNYEKVRTNLNELQTRIGKDIGFIIPLTNSIDSLEELERIYRKAVEVMEED